MPRLRRGRRAAAPATAADAPAAVAAAAPDAATDKDPLDASATAGDAPDAATGASMQPPPLPPRIVIEQPDGAVAMGEDNARLDGERADFEARLEASGGEAAQPGTDRWLDLRRLLYASALDSLIVTRKRHAAVLLSAHSAD
jgi:hypothetical protein